MQDVTELIVNAGNWGPRKMTAVSNAKAAVPYNIHRTEPRAWADQDFSEGPFWWLYCLAAANPK
jgi:hypothetical protein